MVPLVLAVAMPRLFSNQSRDDLVSLDNLAALESRIQSLASTAGVERSAVVQRDLDRLFEIAGKGRGFTGLVGFASGVLGGACLALLYLNSLAGSRRALHANLATAAVILVLLGVNLGAVRYAQVNAVGAYSGTTASLNGFMARLELAAITTRDEMLARQLLRFTDELDTTTDATGNTALHLASDRGMQTLAQEILRQKKQHPDTRNADGATALARAAATAQPEIASLLISAKADVNARDKEGRSPIHFAAEAHRTDIVKMLLDAGADIDAQDNAGRTALSVAYAQSDHELFAALVQRGAQVGHAGEGARLAHEATAEAIRAIERSREDDATAGSGEIERLKQLLRQGADPNGIVKDAGTPLHRVARAVAALPETSRKASRLGAVALVLLDAGANPAIDAGLGEKAYDITYAARFGHVDRVKGYCESDPAAIARGGLYDKTPLVIAVECNRLDVVQTLLDHGARANGWSGAGRTAIESAVMNGSDELVLVLLKNGFATPDEPSPLGGPLHLAAKDGRMAILQPMLEAGYRVDAKDSRGNTPLHVASAAGQTEYAMALVKSGADPLTWNNAGETALSLSESKGHKELHSRLKRTVEKPIRQP